MTPMFYSQWGLALCWQWDSRACTGVSRVLADSDSELAGRCDPGAKLRRGAGQGVRQGQEGHGV